MSRLIQLMGRPVVHGPDPVYRFRSRKSWALLAYLVLAEHPPTRSQLAALLFAEADDPLGALRWGLAEVRRVLGSGGSVDGDPVVLTVDAGTTVDVVVALRSPWREAVRLPGIGSELLEDVAVRGAPAFDSWLLLMRHHLAAASEAVLHEAAVATMSRADFTTALGYAERALRLNPLDENHHALLIRLYRLCGNTEAAQAQLVICLETFRRELGTEPGDVVRDAVQEVLMPPPIAVSELAAAQAVVEAGTASVAAGAAAAGVLTLRTAVHLADRSGDASLRVTGRLSLAEALVHSVGGLDEEGLATLHEADGIAMDDGDLAAVARCRAELGYVDFLRGRYERGTVWLEEALRLGRDDPSVTAKAQTYLGSIESDRANYAEAGELLVQARENARSADDRRREVFVLSMMGRVALLRGELGRAESLLTESLALAEEDHWLAIVPWPQALLGEVHLLRGDTDSASLVLQQAFARACQLADPCWEGISARGLALLAEAVGDHRRAFEVLEDAARRARRLADPYVWLDGYILDAQCVLGRRHAHPDLAVWVDSLRQLGGRTGMKELTVRALLHGSAIGRAGDGDAAQVLAASIDNPRLASLMTASPAARPGAQPAPAPTSAVAGSSPYRR